MPINTANTKPSPSVKSSLATKLPDDIIRTIFDHLLRIETPALAIKSVARFSMVNRNIRMFAENYHLQHLRYRTALTENFSISRIIALATSDLRAIANSTPEIKDTFIKKLEFSGEKKSDFVQAFKSNNLKEKDIKTVQHFAQRILMDNLLHGNNSRSESERFNQLPETAQKKEICTIMKQNMNQLQVSQWSIICLASLAKEYTDENSGLAVTEASKILVSWLNKDLIDQGAYDTEMLINNNPEVKAAYTSSLQRIWSNNTGEALPCRNFIHFFENRNFSSLVINATISYFQKRKRPFSLEEDKFIDQVLYLFNTNYPASESTSRLKKAILKADYSSLNGKIYNQFQDRGFVDNPTQHVALYSFLGLLKETNKLHSYESTQKHGDRWKKLLDQDLQKFYPLKNSKHETIAQFSQFIVEFQKRSPIHAIRHIESKISEITKSLIKNYELDLIGLVDLIVNGPALLQDHAAKLCALDKTIPYFFKNPMKMTKDHADDLIEKKLVPYISFHASTQDIRRLKMMNLINGQVGKAIQSRKAYHLVTSKNAELSSNQRMSEIQTLLLPLISKNTKEIRSIMHPKALFFMLETTALEPEKRQMAIRFCVQMIEEKRFDTLIFHSTSFLNTSIPEAKKAIEHRLLHVQKNLSKGQYDKVLIEQLLNPQKRVSHYHESLLEITLDSFYIKESQNVRIQNPQIAKLTKAVEDRLVKLIEQHKFTAKKTVTAMISKKASQDYKIEPSDDDSNLLALALESHNYSSKAIQKACAEKVKEIKSALYLTDQEQQTLKELQTKFKK